LLKRPRVLSKLVVPSAAFCSTNRAGEPEGPLVGEQTPAIFSLGTRGGFMRKAYSMM
jgi:hypothetical protein